MKPHICKLPGYGKVWYAFHSRAHRDEVVQELTAGVPERWRRRDARTWGLTFTDVLQKLGLANGR